MRFMKEVKIFAKFIEHQIRITNPKALTLSFLNTLQQISMRNELLNKKIAVSLISTVNTWANTNIEIWNKYWSLISQYSFESDEKKDLIIETDFLSEVIETLGKYDRSKYYCCEVNYDKEKINLLLDHWCKPITKLLIELIPISKANVEYGIYLILHKISKTLSHCSTFALIKVLVEIANLSEANAALKKYDLVDIISKLAPNFTVDITKLCLKLPLILLVTSRNDRHESNEIKKIIKSLLYKYYKQANNLHAGEKLCDELITWVTNHKIYENEVTSIPEKNSIHGKLMLLQYLFKISNTLDNEEYTQTIFSALKFNLFDRIDKDLLLNMHGLLKWMLEIEEKVYLKTSSLYDLIINFHIELSANSNPKFIKAHEDYLEKHKKSFDKVMNMSLLLNKVLIKLSNRNVIAMASFTLKVFKYLKESSWDTQEKIVSGKEILVNFLNPIIELFKGIPCCLVINADDLKNLVKNPPEAFKKNEEIINNVHYVLHLLEYGICSFKEEPCFLKALGVLLNYYLVLLEREGYKKTILDYIEETIIVITTIITENTTNYIILNHSLSKLAKTSDTITNLHIKLNNSHNKTSSITLAQTKNNCNNPKAYNIEELKINIKNIIPNREVLKDNAERHNKNVITNLVFLERYRNKCEHKWRKVLKEVKQWQGMWRSKLLFDTQEGLNSIPYKVSSHCFINTARCVTKILSYTHKHITNDKLLLIIQKFARSKEFNTLLSSTITFDIPHEEQVRTAIDLKKLINKWDVNTCIGLILPKESKGKILIKGLNCEIFKQFLIIPGFIFIVILDGQGYIKFLHKNTIYSNKDKEDKRLIFTYKHSSYKKLVKKWCIRELVRLYRIQIIDRETGVELYFEDGQSVLLNFNRKEDANVFCNKLIKVCSKIYKDKYNIVFDRHNEGENLKVMRDWLEHSISTFDYLLYLNSLSSRSFNNISQYPIMPWIIKDYENELNLKEERTYRDLSMPIGMLGIKSRTEHFKKKGTEPDLTGMGQFNYGSHYSNPGIVIQFMMRLYSFFEAYVEFFTGLDDPNRMFHSIKDTYAAACKDTGDIRELIPELFCLPELLVNSFRSNFGERDQETGTTQVNNVLLPQWTKSHPHSFIVKQRRALESKYVASNINQWIDLVFGSKQRGEEAKKAFNVFHPLTTEPKEVLSKLPKEDKEIFRFQAFHWGQTPQQLFKKEHQQKTTHRRLFNSRADQSINIIPLPVQYNDKKIVGKIILISVLAEVTENPNVKEINFIMLNDKGKILEGVIKIIRKGDSLSKTVIFNPTKTYIQHIIPNQYNLAEVMKDGTLLVIKRKGMEGIVQGGYNDGRIKVTSIRNSLRTCLLDTYCNTITALAVDRYDKLLIAGSITGELILYLLDGSEEGNPKEWTAVRYLKDHKAKITTISISDEMQMFISGSLDDSVNLYNKSTSPKLIRTFRLFNKPPITRILLAENPLPCVLIFTGRDNVDSYSINGTLIASLNYSTGSKMYPRIVRNSSFNDCLIYVDNEKKCIVIKRLPELRKISSVDIDKSVSAFVVQKSGDYGLLGCEDGGFNFIYLAFTS